MGFYDSNKRQRDQLVNEMISNIIEDIAGHSLTYVLPYASDPDTYIRKQTYMILGRRYRENPQERKRIRETIEQLFASPDEKARQTAVYVLGEIGEVDEDFLVRAMKDPHHAVRNGVIGTLKTLGVKQPQATLAFADKHIHDGDPEIRRQIIHGIELYGRTHPQDVLPLLREVQNDPNRRVREMLIHVISQISYKKGCLQVIAAELKTWQNQALVEKCLQAILDQHARQSYCAFTLDEAKEIIVELL